MGAYWRRPEAYLDPAVRAGISLFSHPDAPPYLDGLARLGADLESGEWRRRNAELLDLDELDIGYRLLSVGRVIVNVLAHEVAGEGPGLLLVHAGVCDRRMWDGLFEDLARDHRVLRVDMRGFGETPEATEPHILGDDLHDALDAAGIDRATVVGNSFGGRCLPGAGRAPSGTRLGAPAARIRHPRPRLVGAGAPLRRRRGAPDRGR